MCIRDSTWTLPANVAICLGPNFDYDLLKVNREGETEYYVVAKELAANVMQEAGIEEYEVVGTVKGSDLEYVECAHPFLNRKSILILGDHVTLDSGTGCVHTAPGQDVYKRQRSFPAALMRATVSKYPS